MRRLGMILMATLFLACGCSGEEAIPQPPVVPDSGNNDNTSGDSAGNGKVQLLYMGKGSLRVVTEDDKVIYIDPYAGEYSLAADLILVTHEHYDHNAIDRVEKRNDGCRIIRSRDAIIDGEHQKFDLDYVKVEAVEAGFNRYHDVRNCVGYVLTFNNGQKVYVSGDTSTTNQMSEMSEMRIDYALLCTDGVYNMGNEEAAKAAEMINARFNIPYHNSTTSSGKDFSLEAAEQFSAPNKLIVKPGETIVIE